MPQAAGAQEVEAASCSGPQDVDHAVTGTDLPFAQSFTPTSTGALTRARMLIGGASFDPVGDWHLDLVTTVAGTPTFDVLASSTFDDAAVPPGVVSTIEWAFASAPIISAGQTYGLVLSRPSAGNTDVTLRLPATNTDCPGGGSYLSFQLGPFNKLDASADFLYSVFVLPPTEAVTPPPKTTITKKPANRGRGSGKRKRGKRYVFRFQDDLPGVTFLCRIDDEPFEPCSSPAVYAKKELSRGPHTFSVKSVTSAGVESVPQTTEFRVRKRNRSKEQG
jgi:hypothetical protein